MASIPALITDPDMLYEVVDGHIVEMEPMGAYDVWIASLLLGRLQTFAAKKKLGRAVSEMLFDLGPSIGHKRRPDVAFVSFARWPSDRPVPRTEAWGVVPNLAVEVVSPMNVADDIVDRVDEYFRAGVELVWMIFPSQQQVYVYESPTRVRVLTRQDKLTGGDLLPGFRLPLDEFFGEDGTETP
jgi:Uma2 family endonuclease